ncbi:peptidylprolyl isomerase [Vibrio ordalii]|uniref:peptidylprolyl isomerase n=1 Tax=Vibrio ordalii TaxID=28174 RepID=UPI0002482F5E|nr:peptidylprolyl isomerase [Vibrio ordalii]
MMDRLREGVNSIAVKIILGMIILSFVFAGVGSYLVSGGSNAAAKVGNSEIGRGEFEQAYQNERNRMQSQLGDYFANLLADHQYVESFRKSVLDRMVNDLLLEQHAQSLGLRVSDDQVRKMILDMPQFQTGGKFDQEIYQAALRRAGFSAESFAEYLRRDLIRNQLLSAIQGSEFTLQGEVNQQSELISQTRDIRALTLSLSEFAKNVELSDEEITQYYQQNAERYTRPEQVKVAYIELSAQQLKDQMVVSDEQAEQYYQEHLDKYSTQAQRKVSHILVQGDDKAKAQAILDELNAGADFATLAKEKSEDVGSVEEGGSLGWIEHDVMDPAFEQAAFAIEQIGDITGLVKSEFGYHIIRLDDVKAPIAQPYAQVASEIKAEMLDQKAADQFYELQTKLEKVAFESPDSLDEAAKAISAKIQKTDFISQQDAPEILKNPAVLQAILSPEVKEDRLNSEVLEVAPEHVIVVRVDDAREQIVLPLAEVKEQVVAQLSKVKGEQQAIELATKLIDTLKQGDQSLLEQRGLKFAELEMIDRSSSLASSVFSLPKPAADSVVYGQAKAMNGDIVLVELHKVEAKVTPEYNDQITAQLDRIGSQRDLAAILTTLRKNTDIEYYVVSQ